MHNHETSQNPELSHEAIEEARSLHIMQEVIDEHNRNIAKERKLDIHWNNNE
jgi:hypothetical protein